MASATRRDGKKGIAYQLTATIGTRLDGTPIRKFKTWHPPKKMSDKAMDKAAMLAAEEFEKSFQMGYRLDNNQTFAEYAEYVISEKERTGAKPRTTDRYRELLGRVNAAIGHMKLVAIRPQHLNAFYRNLTEPGIRNAPEKATVKIDMTAWLKEHDMSRTKLAEKAGVAAITVSVAARGETINGDKADLIADAMGMKRDEVFSYTKDMTPLSAKTILEHHRLISTVLAKAEKEMLVQYNAASKADPPKVNFKEPEILEPEEVADLLDALETEPLKWRLFVELLLVTSGRRGEVGAIKWKKLDFDTQILLIDCQLVRTRDNGIVEAPTKTNEVRFMELPVECIDLLKLHREEQLALKIANGDRWVETGYVFSRDNGEPMNPEGVTQWLTDFCKRHGLRHIHPHMLRHTGASYYVEQGVDLSTISAQLGHANTVTTQTRYVHSVKEARAKTVGCISELMYARKRQREEADKMRSET